MRVFAVFLFFCVIVGLILFNDLARSIRYEIRAIWDHFARHL